MAALGGRSVTVIHDDRCGCDDVVSEALSLVRSWPGSHAVGRAVRQYVSRSPNVRTDTEFSFCHGTKLGRSLDQWRGITQVVRNLYFSKSTYTRKRSFLARPACRAPSGCHKRSSQSANGRGFRRTRATWCLVSFGLRDARCDSAGASHQVASMRRLVYLEGGQDAGIHDDT